MTPIRIQLSRRKGFRPPPNTVVVARPSRWGNPMRSNVTSRQVAAKQWFLDWLEFRIPIAQLHTLAARRDWILEHLHELRGKNLACWCGVDEACHADVLLEMANRD